MLLGGQARSDASSAAFEAAYGTSPMRGAPAVSDESTATIPPGAMWPRAARAHLVEPDDVGVERGVPGGQVGVDQAAEAGEPDGVSSRSISPLGDRRGTRPPARPAARSLTSSVGVRASSVSRWRASSWATGRRHYPTARRRVHVDRATSLTDAGARRRPRGLAPAGRHDMQSGPASERRRPGRRWRSSGPPRRRRGPAPA